MRLLFLILLVTLQQPATAEVFKCIGKHGAVAYQPSPCDTAIKQQQLQIDSDPIKEVAAKAKLDQVRSEYETRKTAQLQAEKQAAEQNHKAAALEVARQKVLAQQELAAAKRRQTEVVKHKRRQQHQRKPPHHSVRHANRKIW